MEDRFTLGSLFDGIGGFPYAASFYGITPLWASEIDPRCISVTRRHFPNMAHVGAITKLDGTTLSPVDIITFGSPCQDLSMAGKRAGLQGERSSLFNEAIRIIYEMREATDGEYPKWAVWENVPGALSSSGGADFAAVLTAFTKTKIPVPRNGKWANAGMVRSGNLDLAWCVYNAQHFGVPQRRRRIFLVADFRGQSAGEILFVPKSLRGYLATRRTAGQGAAADATCGADGTTNMLDTHAYSLCSKESNSMRSKNPKSGCYMTETARTLDTTNPCPSKNQGGIAVVAVHPPVSGTLCGSGAGLSRPGGQAAETDLCVVAAIDCRNHREIGNISGTLQAKGSSGYSLNFQNPIRTGYIVRRLTPTECERLQGFPDGWTECGPDGKPISDTARYRMLGNAVAVPCVAYIMQGIVMAHEAVV